MANEVGCSAKMLENHRLKDCLMTPVSYLKAKAEAQKLAETHNNQVQLQISFFGKLSFEEQNIGSPT